MDVPKRYTNIEVLNKTINNNNTSEAATDYIIDHYIKTNGEPPTVNYLKKEIETMKKWPLKSKTFFESLKTATSHLNKITVNVYMIDFGN